MGPSPDFELILSVTLTVPGLVHLILILHFSEVNFFVMAAAAHAECCLEYPFESLRVENKFRLFFPA